MSNIKARVPRLGRGLSSLMARAVEVTVVPPRGIEDSPKEETREAGQLSEQSLESKNPPAAKAPADFLSAHEPRSMPRPDGLADIAIASIHRNPHQPRQRFDDASIQQLAASIKIDGVMQPIIVRPAPDLAAGFRRNDEYELVAGERRWRAAQIAGLTRIPAIIRTLSDQQIAEWALIENLQREDLNPIERAEAFQHLLTTFKLSHEQVAARVGVERSSVSNSLRLLDLCDSVRQLVREGLVSGGQAKALASVRDASRQAALAERAVKQDWSVRQLEQAVRVIAPADAARAIEESAVKARHPAAHLADLEQQIARQLQTKVHIKTGRKKGSGSLTIDFYTIDQFDAILGKLGIQTD